MKKILIGLFCCLTITSFAQRGYNHLLLDNYHPTLKTENIKGNVKIIYTYRYDAIENFGEVEKGSGFLKKKLTFDEDGKQTEEIRYNSNGNIEKKKKWAYNRDGSLIEFKRYTKEILRDHRKFKYNSNNKLIEKLKIKSDGSLGSKYVYKYNSEGKMVESQIFIGLARGFKNIYKYNENGTVRENNQYNCYGVFHSKETYLYDTNKHLIMRNTFAENGRQNEKWVWKRNEDGFETFVKDNGYWNSYKEYTLSFFRNTLNDILSLVYISEEGSETNSYSYIYDNQNNWTQKISYKLLNIFGDIKKPLSIVERKIEYY